MARLSPSDARAWDALAGRVAGAVERAMSAGVVANRAVGGGAGWVVEPVGPALRRARRRADRLARGNVLLRTDVRSFYPSVTASTLAASLRTVGVGRDDARRAATMLEGWGSEGYPGLPVGPRGSAVLANAILCSADRALNALAFLRWVDDYLVAAPSERTALEALERLDEALHGLGLRRSHPKTVLGVGSLGWLARSPTRTGGTASMLDAGIPAGTIAAP